MPPSGLRADGARLAEAVTVELARELHPMAWWGWAIGMAIAVSQTTNPLLLALALAVLTVVVVSRRGSSPWAGSFRLYLWLGLFIVAVRLALHILVGLKAGDHLVLSLPSVQLPSWAAGITLFGDLTLEGLIGAALLGLRLAIMVAAVGAANALANPKRLLRALPGALHEIGSAVVVSVTVAPQLADSVQRVRRARELRGAASTGLRAIPAVALPVLEDTLDRSLLLAAAMDSRGYGRHPHALRGGDHITSALTLGGLLAAAVGIYGVLDASTSALLGAPALILGLALSALGLWRGGRGSRRTTYRPDPWRAAEWLTLSCGVTAAVAMLLTARHSPEAIGMPLEPLAWPELPMAAAAGLLVGALPAWLTPQPPRPVHRGILTRAGRVSAGV